MVVLQRTNGTSRGPVSFYRRLNENLKNMSHLHELGINYRNIVCLSLIF